MLEKTLENPLDCKETKPVHPKGNQSWYSLEGLMLKLKLQYSNLCNKMQRTYSLERLKTGEGDNREWDGWMASETWWTWVWVSSRSWCWTGKPGMLQSMGSQRVRHDWATELNWTEMTFWWVCLDLFGTQDSGLLSLIYFCPIFLMKLYDYFWKYILMCFPLTKIIYDHFRKKIKCIKSISNLIYNPTAWR